HEFTHIVQIQTTMKFGRRVPAIYLQFLGYQSERRPDVLYGYPNVIVSYPYSGFVVPVWFAEGVAQYNRNDLRYDFWDSHRDMILRSYALDGNMLSWEQMGVFGKTSLGNESSYNSGFAFVSYIARKYGEKALADISRNLSSLTEMTIDGAIRRAVGKDGSDVFQEWQAEVREDYRARVARIRTNIVEGEPVNFDSTGEVVDPGEMQKPESMIARGALSIPPGAQSGSCCRFDSWTGFANLYPAYSPDGRKFAYVSAKGGDYFALSSLYVYDLATGKEALIRPGVRTSPAWSPDGTSIFYAKSTRDNPHWYFQFDIYRYSFKTQEETRITTGRRAMQPAVSPDGKTLAYVVNADGTTNIALADIDGTHERMLTAYSRGEQVYNPKWSPSGDRLIFDYSMKDGRSIAEIRPDGSGFRLLISGSDDARTGVFSRDGSQIIFASDRTGIFNLYSYDVASARVAQVTNVLGGAFYPTVNASGEILYSAYTSGGYKIYSLARPRNLGEGDFHYVLAEGSPGHPPGLPAATAGPSSPQFNWAALRSYDDTGIPPDTARGYRNIFTSVTYVPFLRFDNYTPTGNFLDAIKPGMYIFSNDVLERIGFFAGAAINRRLERDLFLQFFYRSKIPLLYELGLAPTASLELYNVTRKAGSYISVPDYLIPVNVTYDLLEFDFALSQPFLSQFSTVEFRYAHSRYTSNLEDFINPYTGLIESGNADLYLIANTFYLTFRLDAILPSRTEDISPVGRRIMFRVGRELNLFNPDGQYEVNSSGYLVPVYEHVNFTRLEMTWQEHLPFLFRNHTLNVSLRGGTILGPPVNEYFDFYAGGLIGMKGYPYYSLGGNEVAVAGASYRFPISSNLDFRILQMSFDKLYASFFGDIGNVWGDNSILEGGWKGDAGVELRLETYSFYSYPTRFFFDAAYGFNTFDQYVRSSNSVVTYGRQWQLYLGVLFGFDLD
ncbi:MAG TPA: BamA/TamA family outer membrane protein, partial [Bacteroidota bacterium]|nr:BamA/TamA family outer membrane protein [Bacteroidota bacterium]